MVIASMLVRLAEGALIITWQLAESAGCCDAYAPKRTNCRGGDAVSNMVIDPSEVGLDAARLRRIERHFARYV
ncbi:MAG: hypothetical protein ACXVGI_09570, partial [Mycobacteriaceae bacterium]